MPDNVLMLIDPDAYLELLEGLLPAADGFAVCDVSGEPVCASTEGLRVEFRELLVSRALPVPEDEDGPGLLSVFELPDARTCYLLPFFSSAGQLIGSIVAMMRNNRIGSKAGFERTAIVKLRAVAERLRKEYELTMELNAMADELTGRYEELNLVYAAEEEAEQADQDGDALVPILDSCVAHLDVGLAALIMPEKGVVLSSSNQKDPIRDTSTLLSLLSGELYAWIKSTGASVVFNDFTDPQRARFCPDVPYKVLVCPVLDGKGVVIGLLVTMNRNHQLDFANSDRSLLQALAKKVSKIVQVKYDSLTGLIQRPGFECQLEKSLAVCRKSTFAHSVLSVDVDQLQVINDTIGHDAGDEVIRLVAKTLANNIREGDVVAYLGRGNFAVLLERCPLQQGKKIAEAMRCAVQELKIELHEQLIQARVSVGIVQVNLDTQSVNATLDAADIARDAAKERGRNRVHSFSANDVSISRKKEQMKWVGRIQNALRENRFQLYCQPIVPVADSDERTHFEILLRLLNEEGTIVSPAEFIPAAESYQLMPTVDRWVVSHTFEMLAASEFGRGENNYVCAVNLSGQSLVDADFAEFIITELKRTHVPVKNICFEITETAAIRDLEMAKSFIDTIQAEGCSFSLDDFGTGLSSFAYLKMLPVDYLKIDGSFVRQVNEDPVAEAMVAAINQVGHVMGLKTIAEFVESDDIKKKLVAMNVDYLQGYALGKPCPLEQELAEITANLQRQAG